MASEYTSDPGEPKVVKRGAATPPYNFNPTRRSTRWRSRLQEKEGAPRLAARPALVRERSGCEREFDHGAAGGIGGDHEPKLAGLDAPRAVRRPAAEIAGGQAEGDFPRFAGLERHALEALEFPQRARAGGTGEFPQVKLRDLRAGRAPWLASVTVAVSAPSLSVAPESRVRV